MKEERQVQGPEMDMSVSCDAYSGTVVKSSSTSSLTSVEFFYMFLKGSFKLCAESYM